MALSDARRQALEASQRALEALQRQHEAQQREHEALQARLREEQIRDDEAMTRRLKEEQEEEERRRVADERSRGVLEELAAKLDECRAVASAAEGLKQWDKWSKGFARRRVQEVADAEATRRQLFASGLVAAFRHNTGDNADQLQLEPALRMINEGLDSGRVPFGKEEAVWHLDHLNVENVVMWLAESEDIWYVEG